MYLKNGSLKFEVHPHQFNLTLHHLSQFVFKVTKKSSKVCDWLVKWLIDVNGFKVAEGFSTFRRRSCLYCYLIQKYPVSNEDGKFYWRSNTMQICPLFELVCLSGKQYNWKYFVDISSSQFHKKKRYCHIRCIKWLPRLLCTGHFRFYCNFWICNWPSSNT